MLRRRWLLYLGCLLPWCPDLFAQSLFDSLYASGDTAVLDITTDWRTLLRNKEDKVYQPALVRAGDRAFSGRIRTRGNARLIQCRYPSVKIKLEKASLDSLGYARDMNDLKLVLQCSDNEIGRHYLRQERLVYLMHAIVSPYTHRTVPVRIRSVDGDLLEGFIIESEEQLSERYGAVIIERDKVSSRGLHRPTYLNMCLFNFLVLNTDWNVFNLHNVECLYSEELRALVPIPYDFDYSGYVGASYAVPHEAHGQRSIYEPRWIGRHVKLAELKVAAAEYAAFRQPLYDLVDSYPDLRSSERRRLRDRLDDFYGLLADDRRLARMLR